MDSEFSINGKQIYKYKRYLLNNKKIKKNKLFYKTILGKKIFFRNKSENQSKIFRRSIFVIKNIKKGETLTKNNIKKIRPGYGLSPIYYEKILGRKSPSNFKKNEPLRSAFFNKNIL